MKPYATYAAIFLAAAGPASAQTSASPETMTDAGPRYEMRSEQGGFVRLDRQTGAMSFCTVTGGNLTCRLGADERDAWETSLDEVQARLKTLEERVEALADRQPAAEAAPPPAPSAEAPDPKPAPSAEAPDAKPAPDGDVAREQAELDRAMDVAERALRRFFEVVKELKADLGGEAQPR